MISSRINFVAGPFAALAVGFAGLALPGMSHAENHSQMPEAGMMHVMKDPTCGCCGVWIALAREEGYDIAVTDVDNIMSVKAENGVPDDMIACHTAMIDGYVVEGHVPFEAIEQLLEQRPNVVGISVPGMPFGSPGMGNDPTARYDVVAFGGEAGAGEIFFQVGL